jgi:uncharacterized membrane protein
MEELRFGIEQVTSIVAMAVDIVMVMIVAVGSFRAVIAVAKCLHAGEALATSIREIWLHYAAWIILALEFALAADLIDTVIAPSWQEIGQLGAIAVIRIALGYFLGKDIEEYRKARPQSR